MSITTKDTGETRKLIESIDNLREAQNSHAAQIESLEEHVAELTMVMETLIDRLERLNEEDDDGA